MGRFGARSGVRQRGAGGSGGFDAVLGALGEDRFGALELGDAGAVGGVFGSSEGVDLVVDHGLFLGDFLEVGADGGEVLERGRLGGESDDLGALGEGGAEAHERSLDIGALDEFEQVGHAELHPGGDAGEGGTVLEEGLEEGVEDGGVSMIGFCLHAGIVRPRDGSCKDFVRVFCSWVTGYCHWIAQRKAADCRFIIRWHPVELGWLSWLAEGLGRQHFSEGNGGRAMGTFKYRRLDRENAAVLLVDHQSGLCNIVGDFSPDDFKNNVLATANAAKYFGLPTILTTSFEKGPNGPLIPELKELFPDAPYIARPGQINAWDNEEFVAAVKETGKKQLIIAGVVTEVCVAFPALSAIEEGFEVFVITDASGTFNMTTRESAWSRMEAAGAQLMGWFAMACELHRDWRNDMEGLGTLFSNHLPAYRNLMTSFNAPR